MDEQRLEVALYLTGKTCTEDAVNDNGALADGFCPGMRGVAVIEYDLDFLVQLVVGIVCQLRSGLAAAKHYLCAYPAAEQMVRSYHAVAAVVALARQYNYLGCVGLTVAVRFGHNMGCQPFARRRHKGCRTDSQLLRSFFTVFHLLNCQDPVLYHLRTSCLSGIPRGLLFSFISGMLSPLPPHTPVYA